MEAIECGLAPSCSHVVSGNSSARAAQKGGSHGTLRTAMIGWGPDHQMKGAWPTRGEGTTNRVVADFTISGLGGGRLIATSTVAHLADDININMRHATQTR